MNLDLYYVVNIVKPFSDNGEDKIRYISGPYGSYNDAWVARCECKEISSVFLEVVCYTQTVHMI